MNEQRLSDEVRELSSQLNSTIMEGIAFGGRQDTWPDAHRMTFSISAVTKDLPRMTRATQQKVHNVTFPAAGLMDNTGRRQASRDEVANVSSLEMTRFPGMVQRVAKIYGGNAIITGTPSTNAQGEATYGP